MIKELKINGIATFSEATIMEPLKINFCYGSNGSGKTTISSIIADFPKTAVKVTWSSPAPLQTLVYNRNFIEANFGVTSQIGGIFTLGKDSKEAQEFIIEQRAKADECEKQIKTFSDSKEKLKKEQEKRESDFDTVCWSLKGKYENDFGKAFDGIRHSKKQFSERCVSESKKAVATVPSLNELKRQYSIAFGDARPIYSNFQLIDITQIEQWEKCDLLTQRISGSSDTPIGKFIEFLDNSDWIKQGMPFAEKADGKCPFCQQELSTSIYDDIKAFFDDSYERDLNQIKTFGDQYYQKANALISMLYGYNIEPLPMLDYTLLKAELDTLELISEGNLKELEHKINSPSIEAKVESLCPIIERINEVLAGFNKLIVENNDFANNQKTKQTECVNGVWQIVISELKTTIAAYERATAGNRRGIKALNDKIEEQTRRHKEFFQLIAEKEATLTSVKPTADAINSILNRFGFEGFKIIENPDETGTYKLVRSDGSNVERTLSEGEYNFVCFLYFYYLVYGSQDKTGIAQSKVIVIDDPISSLDSNVLFIVSTLTKQIVDDCKNNRMGIKQVFVLTHNIYFHKEATFLGSGKEWKKDETAFWVIKKNKNISRIVGHDNKNPIQTSYELLWSELKDKESIQRITIFNTLRRILEYYFNVIGGLDYEDCIHKFEGEDLLTCKSLIACINEGSHFITDDFVMQYESSAIENYIRVFKLIFDYMGHSSHYNMMMGGAK